MLKFLTQFIPKHEKVMTIEDNLEIHYRDINPGANCVELRVDEEFFSYTKAIKSALRQNPQWVLLSEARSTEVKYLLECFSTGLHGLTTLHAVIRGRSLNGIRKYDAGFLCGIQNGK